jgi:hypothetical protein
MEVFKNHDEGYLAWHTAHANAYVLNRFGSTNPAANVLHSSNCAFLWRDKDDGSRTAVEKWCSASEQELVSQADSVLGQGMWKKCGVCLRSSLVDSPAAPSLPSAKNVADTPTDGMWVCGEPAVWLGSGEKEWKQLVAASLSNKAPDEKPQWLDIEFRLPQNKLYRKDIDNLLTPVLESGRDAGWIERGFANVGSVTAKKIGVADSGMAGVVIKHRALPPNLAFCRSGILIEAPVAGLDADTVKWALYEQSFELFQHRPELRFPPQYAISMEIRVTVNNAGRRKSLQALMKPCIDGMEPLLGHPDNLLPVPRAELHRRIAPQDEIVMSLAFHVRGGDANEVAVVLCPFQPF